MVNLALLPTILSSTVYTYKAIPLLPIVAASMPQTIGLFVPLSDKGEELYLIVVAGMTALSLFIPNESDDCKCRSKKRK